MERTTPQPSRQTLRALDALNLFVADVRDGLGPYLAIYLTARNWGAGQIGIAMSAMGIASVLAQTPVGAYLDQTRRKRRAVVVAAMAIGLGAIVMTWSPTFPVIVAAQVVIGAASAVFGPAIAAISLGLVGRSALARRTGRNEAFNHAGNVAAALLAGAIGDLIAFEGIFYLVALLGVASIASTRLIRPEEINHDLARGRDLDPRPVRLERGSGSERPGRDGSASEADEAPPLASVGDLLHDRRVVVFALAVVLFHFANAAMLPLVGQKVAATQNGAAASLMSACIIVAQLTMIPVALLASRLAESWGRRAVFLIGFAVLPIRGVLYTGTNNPYALVAVQLLDGIGAGVFGVVGVLTIADLTRGTGRFNVMQGALATATGLGAALSNLTTGFVVKATSVDVGFLCLAVIATLALLFYTLAMPETRPSDDPNPNSNPEPILETEARPPLAISLEPSS